MKFPCLILAAGLILGFLPPAAQAEDQKPSRWKFWLKNEAKTKAGPKAESKDLTEGLSKDPALYSKQQEPEQQEQEKPREGIVIRHREVQANSNKPLRERMLSEMTGRQPVQPLGPGVAPAFRNFGTREQPRKQPSAPEAPRQDRTENKPAEIEKER